MRTLSFLFLLSLGLAKGAHAEARRFRVIEGTSHAFGLAWGVKDSSVDFEQLERGGDTDKFIDQNEALFQNYLVDLKTNRILGVVAGPDSDNARVSFTFGGLHFGNNYGIGIEELDTTSDLLDGRNYATLVAENISYKWNNELGNIYVIQSEKEDDNNFQPTVVAQCKGCQAQIDSMLKAKMSAADSAIFDKLYERDVEFKVVRNAQDKASLELTVSADGGKSEEIKDVINIQASFGYAVQGDRLVLTLQNFKMNHKK